jgi:glycosyltransferase involved in cell wall biosynthesis
MTSRGPLTSVVVVVHNMLRAAPRTLRSLSPGYQTGLGADAYEIIVVDNGSSVPLPAADLDLGGGNVHYHRIADAPPSPARALNYGAVKARGDVLCLIVDGAHMLTPGVLNAGTRMFKAAANPVVLTPQFFLGPGPQTETIGRGYDEKEEDRLLGSIGWPRDGYRLFEIGDPYRIRLASGIVPRPFWFVKMFESNCLFVKKTTFEQIGGCDEAFDLPGGGFMLPDLYCRLARVPGIEIIQLFGEASFHQVHGGISTNATPEAQLEQLAAYKKQYREIRGEEWKIPPNPVQFFGHAPTRHARRYLLEG